MGGVIINIRNSPQFHFSPETIWMNDPNGMVYQDGEYHLFYQYHPVSKVWGHMHWGLAVSKDLVKWEHLPIALYPDSLGYIFSGSGLIDKTSTYGENALVVIYTYHDPIKKQNERNDFQYHIDYLCSAQVQSPSSSFHETVHLTGINTRNY